MQAQANLESTPLWVKRQDGDMSAANALARELGCPEVVARVLVARRIDTLRSATQFFEPQMESLLNDLASNPMQMLGMRPAVERILTAVRACEPVMVYGDYDVDGTTATVLLKTTIERIGAAMQPIRAVPVSYHVPHRIREGYGMQSGVLAAAAENGVRLVISVDTGIRAVAEAAEARRIGLDLIVTDHHLPDGMTELPECIAVINPAQLGCCYGNKNLCGAAVAFKLAHALLFAAASEMPDPAAWLKRVREVLLPSFLKLVAIATIADSVPLTGENRTIASLGLAALAQPVQPGLRALLQLAAIPMERAPSAGEVGFRIAPRINAAGRMDVASDVVELLLTRDGVRARELAEKLDRLNQERRDSETRALDAIDRELQALVGEDGCYPAECLVLDHSEWHRGVLGILASRVVERTGRPALVLTHADGDAHGSGRSVKGFHLLDALTAVDKDGDLFHRFGGHAHAVGFSMPSERLDDLRERMRRHAEVALTAEVLRPRIEYDAELGFGDLTVELVEWVSRCAPFGIGNPEPVFLTRGAVVTAPVRLIQEKHVCLQLGEAIRDGVSIPALGWSNGGANWASVCASLKIKPGTRVDVLYRLRRNTGPYAGAHFEGLEMELHGVCESVPHA
ncbi:MAG TPA: single-stranded-DNA-specific exonuclease RecJ [Acidobacteriaceae bacterium]|nr:single-stranded-DNA-specific exonuclease RecJ [Acidobacteriaceae bacterium]